jgi:hypothetical protein
MSDEQEQTEPNIFERFRTSPPSPILIGTIAVLAIIVLLASGYSLSYGKVSYATQNMTFSELRADYDITTYKFHSHNVGEIVYVRDVVNQSYYSAYSNYTTLTFEYTWYGYTSNEYIRVYGDVHAVYPSGTMVILSLYIIQASGYQDISTTITPDQIQLA